MAAGMGRGICMLATILALISFSQAISITLDPSNPKVCFYIRGENVDSEFILNYGYSGDGFDSVRTTFKNIKEKTYLYEAKPGHEMAVNGFINQKIDQDKVYSVCFESLDRNRKFVSFDYSQANRQKHFTKGELS